MKVLKAIFVLVLFVGLIATPQSKAGEVIDYLPEILLARSLDAYNLLGAGIELPPESSITVCFDDDPGPETPDHMLINEHGLYRTPAETLAVIVAVECKTVFTDTTKLNPIPILLGEIIDSTIFLRNSSGEIVRGASQVDGSKQSNRVRAAIQWFGLFAQLREFDVEPFTLMPDILPNNPCETFRDWVLNAPTLELQWASFQVLMNDQIRVSEDGANVVGLNERVCATERTGTEAELRAAAESGDLEAAFALSWLWRGQASMLLSSREEFEGTEQAQFIDDEIERFELLILTNTERYPLVTLAAIEPLVTLYLADRLFHGEAE